MRYVYILTKMIDFELELQKMQNYAVLHIGVGTRGLAAPFLALEGSASPPNVCSCELYIASLYYSYLFDLQHGFSHWLALQLFDVATPVLLLAEGRLQNLDLRNDVKYDIYAWPGLHTLVWLRI